MLKSLTKSNDVAKVNGKSNLQWQKNMSSALSEALALRNVPECNDPNCKPHMCSWHLARNRVILVRYPATYNLIDDKIMLLTSRLRDMKLHTRRVDFEEPSDAQQFALEISKHKFVKVQCPYDGMFELTLSEKNKFIGFSFSSSSGSNEFKRICSALKTPEDNGFVCVDRAELMREEKEEKQEQKESIKEALTVCEQLAFYDEQYDEQKDLLSDDKQKDLLANTNVKIAVYLHTTNIDRIDERFQKVVAWVNATFDETIGKSHPDSSSVVDVEAEGQFAYVMLSKRHKIELITSPANSPSPQSPLSEKV